LSEHVEGPRERTRAVSRSPRTTPEKESTLRVYEGLFLLDSGKSVDWNAATNHVHGILTRYGATVIDSRKWDERRLAYEIHGHKRGTYMLVYFDVPRAAIAQVRHDLELSEMVLRYLIVVKEKFTPPNPGEALVLPPGEGPAEELPEGARFGHDDDFRPRRRRPERDERREFGRESGPDVPAEEGGHGDERGS
jgi:small subunit ribosomal protein S6